ncbi:urocortin-3-like [Acipenser oxyrinchus oxyrinchus]|uniref:Urocortin-3-like n=1 Tax=Acipenser oxyrinchus oxyrinchus TaxID=40147 RepID=A0AAD8D358_ACIOX|nr:urocortin-3-like [Acipenser oxyrinchus oxyrinchus]
MYLGRLPLLLAALLASGALSHVLESKGQRQGYSNVPEEGGLLAVRILSRAGVLLRSLLDGGLPSEWGAMEHRYPQRKRAAPSRPARRSPHGTRFSLSLDVPTSILSILLDLARAKDMRAKAAANAELMARIGRRK